MKIHETAQRLVGNGQLRKCFTLLENNLESSEHLDELSILSGKLAALEKKERTMEIDHHTLIVERNRIVYSLLLFVNLLDDKKYLSPE